MAATLLILAAAATLTACASDAEPLSAEDILHRSEQAMAALPLVRVDTVEWPAPPDDPTPRQLVTEYQGLTHRTPYISDYTTQSCVTHTLDAPAFANRSQGALAHGQAFAQQPPGAYHLLGETTIDIQPAWIIRYAFKYTGIDSTIEVEATEWITKGSYLLVRQEREYHDPLGFAGHIVSVIRPTDTPSACPATPIYKPGELRPAAHHYR